MKGKVSALTIILAIITLALIYFTSASYADYKSEDNVYRNFLTKGLRESDIDYSTLTLEKKILLGDFRLSNQILDSTLESRYLSYVVLASSRFSEKLFALTLFVFLTILSWKFDCLKKKN